MVLSHIVTALWMWTIGVATPQPLAPWVVRSGVAVPRTIKIPAFEMLLGLSAVVVVGQEGYQFPGFPALVCWVHVPALREG